MSGQVPLLCPAGCRKGVLGALVLSNHQASLSAQLWSCTKGGAGLNCMLGLVSLDLWTFKDSAGLNCMPPLVSIAMDRPAATS